MRDKMCNGVDSHAQENLFLIETDTYKDQVSVDARWE